MKYLSLVNREIQKEEKLDGLITYFNYNSFNLNEYLSAIVTTTLEGTDPFAPLQRDDTKNWESDHKDTNPEYTIVFLKNRVSLNGYGFRTDDGPGNPDFPRSWYVHGSNDRENWTQIDYKPPEDHFTDFDQIKNFKVEKQEPFRFLRFQLNGKNYAGTDYFCFMQIEVYGSMYIDKFSYNNNFIIPFKFSVFTSLFIL